MYDEYVAVFVGVRSDVAVFAAAGAGIRDRLIVRQVFVQ